MHKIFSILPVVFLWLGCPVDPANPEPSDLEMLAGWDCAAVFPLADIPDFAPDSLPELQTPELGKTVILRPDLPNLQAILDDPTFTYYEIKPGTYPILKLSRRSSGGRIVLAATNDPLIADENNLTIIKGLDVQGDGWVIHGLHVEGKGIRILGNNNTVNNCVFSKANLQIDGGSFNTVQYSLFKDRPRVPVDYIGTYIVAGPNDEARGNRVLYNEYAGMSDGVQVGWNEYSNSGSTPATVIAYNTSYVPDSMYIEWVSPSGRVHTYSMCEDGFDIKNGATTVLTEDRSYLVGNVSYGHRHTVDSLDGNKMASRSPGSGYTLHRRAMNWLVEGNLSYNDARGFAVNKYQENSKDKVQNILLQNNLVLNLDTSVDTLYLYDPEKGHFNKPNKDLGVAYKVLCNTCTLLENDPGVNTFFINTRPLQGAERLLIDIERERSKVGL